MKEFKTRKQIRLKNYDYSNNGLYFVTICADEYTIMPNHIHGIINIIVGAIPCNRPIKNNDDNIIKNNKNHTIKGENTVSPLRISNSYNGLGQCMSWFKCMTTNQYIQNVKNNNWQSFDKHLWQRNYHDHIIRNDKSLNNIRQYIANNPATWDTDEHNIINYSIEDKACLVPTHILQKMRNIEK